MQFELIAEWSDIYFSNSFIDDNSTIANNVIHLTTTAEH